MFKIRKRKLMQNVVRVEDLQVGDILQYVLGTQATVERVIQLNDQMYWIKLKDFTPRESIDDTMTATLHGIQKVFVWR